MVGVETLCLIPFTIKYKQLNKAGKCIYYYLVFSLTLAVGSYLLGSIGRNNMWFMTIMYFLQFVALSAFFYHVTHSPFVRKLIKVVSGVAIGVFIIDYSKLEGLRFFNSISTSIGSFILITYGVLFFFQLLRDEELIQKSIYINSLPNFWFNAGLFIYQCCSFMFNLSYNFLQTNAIVTSTLLTLIYISGIIQIILFYIGVLKVKRVAP